MNPLKSVLYTALCSHVGIILAKSKLMSGCAWLQWVMAKSRIPSKVWNASPFELYNVIMLSHKRGTVRRTFSVGVSVQYLYLIKLSNLLLTNCCNNRTSKVVFPHLTSWKYLFTQVSDLDFKPFEHTL